MITEIEDFFTKGCGRCDRFATADCSAQLWKPGLERLRALCRATGLVETVKWGHPCYMHAGRNIALIGAFRADFRINFFNAALLKDVDGILEKQGPNSRHADTMRFTDSTAVELRSGTIQAYLQEAMQYAEQGIKPPKDETEMAWPEELREALDVDPVLANAFSRLTPGRQKSYLINLNSAKKPETRVARIEKFRPLIMAGKGANER